MFNLNTFFTSEYKILSCSKRFESRLNTFHSDIEFWKTAFSIISNVKWENNNLSIKEYLDFFEYKKYFQLQLYTLNGQTLDSITQSIHKWHEPADFHNKIILACNSKCNK